jgi:hypothetical protein
VAVDAKDEPFSFPRNRTTALYVFFEHAQNLIINGQHPLSTLFLLLGLSFPDLTSTFWAKGVTSAQSLSALGAGQLEAGFKVFNGNRAVLEVYVFNRQSQSLADAAA